MTANGSSPDLSDFDDEDIPTGVRVNMIARAVGRQRRATEETQAEIRKVSADVGEIKSSIDTAIKTGKAFVRVLIWAGGVGFTIVCALGAAIVAIGGAVAWALAHLSVHP